MCAAYPRVLLAENGFTATGVVVRALCSEKGQAMEVLSVPKRNDLSLALRTYCPDIAVLDLELFHPDIPAGVSSLHHSAPHIPLILFAYRADRDLAEQCLRAGAKDFMLEGYMDGRTLDRVMRTALSEPAAALPLGAGHEPLTGLLNRAGLIEESRRWCKTHALSDKRLVVSIRVQNLEAIELMSGEAAAELLLRKMAYLLQKKVRSSDCVAHVAPGHFVLLIQDVSERSLPIVHRRISNCLAEFNDSASGGGFPVFALHSEFLPSGSAASFTEMLGTGEEREARETHAALKRSAASF